MPRVLIPTNDDDPGLIDAYRSYGWDVVVGLDTFRNRIGKFDVVHHQWPEEYSEWQAPTAQQLSEIQDCLDWWCSRATNIFTVHNLYPHYAVDHPASHELYSSFYRYCHLISHFSETSHRLVLERFAAARRSRHIVHCPANNAVALVTQKQRGSCRTELGIGEDEFVILMIGRIRSWAEAKLLRRAYDLARVPNKRLLMVGKFAVQAPSWRGRLLSYKWNSWLRSRHAVIDTRYVPENELSRFLDSSDVAIVPRFGGLNSGIVFLAMTFGRMVIAPNCGAYPEQLAGSRNLLFETGDAMSLALKLEEAAALDTDAIGRENGAIAAQWGWRKICRACLEATDFGSSTFKEIAEIVPR